MTAINNSKAILAGYNNKNKNTNMHKLARKINEEMEFFNALSDFYARYEARISKMDADVLVYHDKVVFRGGEESVLDGEWCSVTGKDGMRLAFMCEDMPSVTEWKCRQVTETFAKNLARSKSLGSERFDARSIWEPIEDSSCFKQSWDLMIAKSKWECDWRCRRREEDGGEPDEVVRAWRDFRNWLCEVQSRGGYDCSGEIATVDKKLETYEAGIPVNDIAE